MVLDDSLLLVSMPCTPSCSGVRVELTDYLLMRTIWQKWWDAISKIRLEKDRGLWLGSLSVSLFLCLSLRSLNSWESQEGAIWKEPCEAGSTHIPGGALTGLQTQRHHKATSATARETPRHNHPATLLWSCRATYTAEITYICFPQLLSLGIIRVRR